MSYDYPLLESVIRLLAAILCGALIGLERERRFKNAGIRTHVIVALTSAMMMIVSKYGFFDVLHYESISLDPSRIAAGLVTAIGFLGAGVIILRGDASAMGLTTAAGLWATVGVGMCMGAGMYILGTVATVFMLLVQMLLHIKTLRIMSDAAGEITVNLSRSNLTVDEVKEHLSDKGIAMRNAVVKRGPDGEMRLTLGISFRNSAAEEILESLKKVDFIENMTIFLQF